MSIENSQTLLKIKTRIDNSCNSDFFNFFVKQLKDLEKLKPENTKGFFQKTK